MGWVKDNRLLLLTFAGVLIGGTLGFGLRPLALGYEAQAWVKIWGELYLRMLKALILPIIVTCLVKGISSMNASASGKLGGITMLYIILTQLIAVILGIILAVTMKPGQSFGGKHPDQTSVTSYTDVFTDFLSNMFPDNIVRATLQNSYTATESVPHSNTSNTTSDILRTQAYHDRMNTMGILTISIAIALGIRAAGELAQPLVQLIEAVNIVTFKILLGVLWVSPIGIASLIAGAIVGIDDIQGALTAVAMYVLAVVSGCLIHQLIILPTIFFLMLRKNPYKFYWQVIDALLLALSTASSAPPLPILLQRLPDKLGVSSKVANFALPLEVIFNRDGSAMFVCIAAIFVSQTYGITLDVGSILVLGFMTIFMSAVISNVPSASVILLIMVGGAINLPINDRLALIMAVEWLVDRVRTICNMSSNVLGPPIIEHLNFQGCSCRRKVQTSLYINAGNGSSKELDQIDSSHNSNKNFDTMVSDLVC